ncbi:MAG TPA: hypothetical protein VLE99_04875 [Candidatus Saccharimonadales bacterium]|nr:hypothetical protein [Candidatus Saccharimonadales bacterium]
MSEFTPLAETGYSRIEQLVWLLGALEQEVMNPGFAGMVGLFDEGVQLSEVPSERLRQLEGIVSGSDWGDWRKGAERRVVHEAELGTDGAPQLEVSQVDETETEPPDPLEDPESDLGKKIFAAARPLRLLGAVPFTVAARVDPNADRVVVILGGTERAAHQRLAWWLGQGATSDVIVGIGAVNADPTKPSPEPGHMINAFAVQLGGKGESYTVPHTAYESPDAEVGVTPYALPDGTEAYVLTAPAPGSMAGRQLTERRRANTPQTIAVIRQFLGERLRPGAEAVLSTGKLYQFQLWDMLREITLPTGATVSSTFYDTDSTFYGMDYAAVRRLPKDLVQETRSLVKSLFRFRNALQAAIAAELPSLNMEMAMLDMELATLEGRRIAQEWTLANMYLGPNDHEAGSYRQLEEADYQANKQRIERLRAVREVMGRAAVV